MTLTIRKHTFFATTYRYFPFYQKLPFLLPFFGLSSVTYPLFSVGRERARGDYNCYCFAIKGAAPTLMSYSHERIQRVDIVHSLLESIIYPTKWYTVHIFGKSRFYYTPVSKSKPDLAKVCVCFNLNIVFFCFNLSRAISIPRRVVATRPLGPDRFRPAALIYGVVPKSP